MMRTGDGLDHVLQEARIIARPSASGIDQRRAAAARQDQRIDAERCAAPIDMRVQIDQARRHDHARRHRGRCRRRRRDQSPVADDLAAGKGDIHDAVDGLATDR